MLLHVRTAPGSSATPYFQPDAAILTARFQAKVLPSAHGVSGKP